MGRLIMLKTCKLMKMAKVVIFANLILSAGLAVVVNGVGERISTILDKLDGVRVHELTKLSLIVDFFSLTHPIQL
jgi:hypothetical protein